MSLEGMRAFLAGSGEVGFKATSRKELYEWTERTLCGQEYHLLGKVDKGLVKRKRQSNPIYERGLFSGEVGG